MEKIINYVSGVLLLLTPYISAMAISSFESDSSEYQKVVANVSETEVIEEETSMYTYEWWAQECYKLGDGWAPAVINSQEEYDILRTGQRSLTDNRAYWIGGSSDFPGIFPSYPEGYRTDSRGVFKVFVQTNAPDTGHSNENFRLQVRSTFRTAGILCEKENSPDFNLEYNTMESEYMKLINTTKHDFNYWNQKCSDIGYGWYPAIINSPAEYELIEQKRKEFSDEHSFWIGGSTNIEERNFIQFPQYIQNSTGERKVFIANINCEVYVRRDSFQLVSSEGDTLLPAILCEKDATCGPASEDITSFESETSWYQKLTSNLTYNLTYDEIRKLSPLSTDSHKYSWWERKCLAIGYSAAIINSQEEYDFIKEGVKRLCDVNNYFIGGSSDRTYSVLNYPRDYRTDSRGVTRIWVNTYKFPKWSNDNFVLQTFSTQGWDVQLYGILCEKRKP